jgi:hypothetical protein
MRSSRDTYGIKTLRVGQRKYIADRKVCDFRRCFAQHFKRHEWVRHKAFDAKQIGDCLEVRRVK